MNSIGWDRQVMPQDDFGKVGISRFDGPLRRGSDGMDKGP